MRTGTGPVRRTPPGPLLGLLLGPLLGLLAPGPAGAASETQEFTVVRTVEAAEAHQGVAVDAGHLYAIGTKEIGKYDRRTGERVAGWKASKGDGIIHLDSGVVVGGRLYAGHSNWPRVPMDSSIEVWDAATLSRAKGVPLGEAYGSCTWIDRYDGAWWVCYAHYDGPSGYPDRGPEATTLVKYDDDFKELGRWTFPEKVYRLFAPNSCSGGSWGPDGLLYCSGHDRPELYAMRLPEKGGVLELVRTVKVQSEGQGLAWDRSRAGTICTIRRSKRRIVVSERRERER